MEKRRERRERGGERSEPLSSGLEYVHRLSVAASEVFQHVRLFLCNLVI